jgi:GAF domain-containing protein
MRRGPRPTKSKEAKPSGGHKLPREDARVQDLEKRLAEALERLQTRDRELTEAQEQQTATSEILRVISRSPTDVQPVFDVIAESAARLCEGIFGVVYRLDGDTVHMVAHHNLSPEGWAAYQALYPRSLNRQTNSGRAMLEGRVAITEDVEADTERSAATREAARLMGLRSAVTIPLRGRERTIGALTVGRDKPGTFTTKQVGLLQTFADQAVIAIENVRLFTELQASNRELTMALDQQTATSDILKVISSSPTDAQPVFNAIVHAAVRLCHAVQGNVQLFDGQRMHFVAAHNIGLAAIEMVQRVFPMPPSRNQMASRAILDNAVVHVSDVLEDPEYLRELAVQGGWRSVLSVPMVDKGRPMGALTVTRMEPGLFSDTEIALLQTFADQAVIAIENARLFTELQASNRQLTEALDQQTATSEILRVIASSPTDVQPVFGAIAEAAMRLCGAHSSLVTTFDGELLHLFAQADISPEGREAVRDVYPRRPIRGFASGRSVLTRAIVQIPDLTADPEFDVQVGAVVARVRDFRSILAVPMLRDGLPIGTINAHKAQPGPFTDTQVALLQTFADQAVIALENVRLFRELGERNRQLTEALEQQTATSEVLKVISRSTFELEPVLETLIENATRLCGADRGQVYKTEGEVLRSATAYGLTPEVGAYLEQRPLPIGPNTMAGRAALERRTIHSSDVLAETWFQPPDDRHKILGLRTVLAVAMLRGETVVGVFTIWKTAVEPFTDRQIELVTTFADQAAIAIENVRLFKELEARTRDLTHSVEELRALGEVSQAVSSTLELETVLATIVSRAVQISGSYEGIVYEFDEVTQTFHARATHQITPEHLEALRRTPVRLGEGAVGRAGVIREPIQVADIEAEWQLVAPQVRTLHAREGMRSLLAIPLVREDRLFGGLVILRRDRGAFPPDVVATLRTLGAQSVLAIQNARLFREIEQKSRELETASQHKSEFLANMSHELRTPLNAIIGFSEVLGERLFGELNEKQEEYLKDIHASGQHLLSLINDILDLSKIEAGRMELELTDFDLPTAIDNALTLVRERAGRRGIALHQATDEDLGQIRGDERKIKQVLLNLLSNAIKFTPDGGQIDVQARAVDGSIEVSVSDTGVGIAPEDQEAIFEEFRQVGTADKKVEGTGLGLALSRRFIELHGGRIWVESQVGVGSTFSFTIPVTQEC